MIESETIARRVGYQGAPGGYNEKALLSALPEASAAGSAAWGGQERIG